VVRNVQTRLMRYYYLVIVMDSYGPELIEEHQQLVRAIKSGNPELARARATEHLSNTSRRSANVDLRSVNFSNDGLLGEEYTRGPLNGSAPAIWTSKRLPMARRSKLRAT
jgi:hypothetical protein